MIALPCTGACLGRLHLPCILLLHTHILIACDTQVLALCGVCLLCAAALSGADQSPEPAKSGTELDKAIEANVEAQDYAEETAPVRAQIIKGEPAALIASGTGDISTTGAPLMEMPFCGPIDSMGRWQDRAVSIAELGSLADKRDVIQKSDPVPAFASCLSSLDSSLKRNPGSRPSCLS